MWITFNNSHNSHLYHPLQQLTMLQQFHASIVLTFQNIIYVFENWLTCIFTPIHAYLSNSVIHFSPSFAIRVYLTDARRFVVCHLLCLVLPSSLPNTTNFSPVLPDYLTLPCPRRIHWYIATSFTSISRLYASHFLVSVSCTALNHSFHWINPIVVTSFYTFLPFHMSRTSNLC